MCCGKKINVVKLDIIIHVHNYNYNYSYTD